MTNARTSPKFPPFTCGGKGAVCCAAEAVAVWLSLELRQMVRALSKSLFERRIYAWMRAFRLWKASRTIGLLL